MIRLLIFDLDGTLVDSAPDYLKAANRLLSEEGKPGLDLPQIIRGLGAGLRILLHGFFLDEDLQSPRFQNLLDRFQEYYLEVCTEKAKLYPDVLPFLESCSLNIAMVTNKNLKPTMKIIDSLGLAKFDWQQIYGFESFADRKPHPRPLLEAMKKCGCRAEQTLMIGDSVPDIQAAHAAGVKSIAVTFGYNTHETLAPYKPTAFLDSYTDLPTLIASLKGLSIKAIN